LIFLSSETLTGATYTVVSLVGQNVKEGAIAHNGLNVSELEQGIYMINIQLENGNVLNEQFVKSE
jgi:hypothetical protein